MNNLSKKIILSGGGTGGSVTPLLSIFRDLESDYDFLFVGTYNGIEKGVAKKEGLSYRSILSGKWRRYFSLLNFIDIFKVFFAFWQSLILLAQEKPSLVISVGGFVAVPLSWAAWFLKIPVIIHQQDVLPGLANKLMSRVAKIVTVSFPSALDFYGSQARWIGNLGPSIEKLNFNEEEIKSIYGIKKSDKALVLILGGGTGSLFINNLVSDSIESLSSLAHIIHATGEDKRDIESNLKIDNYFKTDFIPRQDLLALMSLADLVVSRCGLATLTELSFLEKASILIPIPNSHQEYNALEFEKKGAAKVLGQMNLNSDIFIKEIENILNNQKIKNDLSKNISGVIKNGNKDMIAIIKSFL